MMNPDEIVVIPRYALRLRLSLLSLPLISGVTLWVLVARAPRDPIVYLVLLFFLGGLLAVWPRFYRKIRFGRSIVLERYLLPPRIVEYSSITDVGIGVLMTSQGNITLPNWDNVADFDAAVQECRKRGHWTDAQIKGELVQQQIAAAITGAIAIPVAIVGSIVAVYWQPFGIELHPMLWFLGICAPIVLLLHVYFRRRAA